MTASNPADLSFALIRRARRRRNVETLQRALYDAIAASTFGAALLVLLALSSGIEAVAVGMGSVAVALAATVWVVVRQARRRWLGRTRAVAWVDATAGLDHRLVTWVSRQDSASAFMPLLIAESTDRLAPWTLDRLTPDRVPWAHLAVAVGGTYVLALVILTAPQWRPATMPLAAADGAVATAADPALAELAQRRLATTGAPRGAGTPSGDASGASAGEHGAAAKSLGMLPRVASALQRALRARLWGAEWARVADAHEAAPSPTATAADSHDRTASTRSAARAQTARGAVGPRDAGEPIDGAGGTRAGAGTDPNLYGTRTTDDATAAGRFPIGLAALVRGPRGDPGPPSGEAPPAEPDVHPELAPVPRAPLPFPRTTVPAEWESVIRSVYAHREGDPP
jgi:hypothetical protein